MIKKDAILILLRRELGVGLKPHGLGTYVRVYLRRPRDSLDVQPGRSPVLDRQFRAIERMITEACSADKLG